MNMNLSKFKKIKEGSEAAILEHPSGHRFIVNKGALKKEHLDELKKLPLCGGGKVQRFAGDPDDPEASVVQPDDSKSSPPVIINVGQPTPANPAPAYDMWGNENSPAQIENVSNNGPQKRLEAIINDRSMPESVKQAAMEHAGVYKSSDLAGNDKYVSTNTAPEKNSYGSPQDLNIPANAQSPSIQPPSSEDQQSEQRILNDPNVSEAAKNEASQSMSAQGPQAMPDAHPIGPTSGGAPMAQPSAGVGSPIAQAPSMDANDPFGTNAAIQGLNEKRQAAVNTGQIESQNAAAQSKIYGASAFDQGQRLMEAQKTMEDLHGEINKVVADQRANFIKPNHYIQNMGTGQKILTAIGLALGGFSNAINHTGNPAMEFLKNQIDNDVNAQWRNQNTRTDLLKAYQDQFHNERDAFDMYKAARLAIASDQLNQQAQKSGDPLAIERARALTGNLDQERSQLISQIGIRRALMGGGMGGAPQESSANPTQGAEGMLNYLRAQGDPRAKDYEERLVPGVGMAQVPVPSDVRQKIIAGQDFQNKINQATQFAKKYGGSLDPAVMSRGKVIASQLQNAFRVASHSGVFKESDQNFIERSLPNDPTAFFGAYRTIPRYREMAKQAKSELNTTLKGYGLPSTPEFDEGAPVLGK